MRNLVCLLGVAAAVGWGCDREERRSSVPPREPNACVQAAFKGATVSEAYSRLIALGANEVSRLDWRAFVQVVRILGSKPDAAPPPGSQQPDEAELFWGFTLANMRGGAWEDRLDGLCCSAGHERAASALERYWRLSPARHVKSRFYWNRIRAMGGHPILESLWSLFVPALRRELPHDSRLELAPPDPGVRVVLVPRPPAGRARASSKPSQDPFDYLAASDIREMVTREKMFFSDKWDFLESLPGTIPERQSLTAELCPWVLKEAELALRPRLSQVSKRTETPVGFLRELLPEFRGIADLLLSRYLAKGPGDELDDAVVAWLEVRIKDGSRRYRWRPTHVDPLGAMVVEYLPKWTSKYPHLAKVEESFRKELKPLPSSGPALELRIRPPGVTPRP